MDRFEKFMLLFFFIIALVIAYSFLKLDYSAAQEGFKQFLSGKVPL